MKQFVEDNWFKILGAIILLIALADNPYSYYQFLRWAIVIIAGYTAYTAYNTRKTGWAWVFGVMAILFNPIMPFYFSKDTWQLIDFCSAVIFVVSIFQKHDKQS